MKKYCLLSLLILAHVMMATSSEQIVEAAKSGDLKTVREILTRDPVKVNALDEEKYTPLHWACMRAHWGVARYLIEQGADLNIQGGDGGTPLNWAVHHDQVDIVESMIDQGARLNVQNRWGMTELHTAIWRGNIHVAACLLDRGSDPGIRTKEGWTAMHYAFRSGHDHVIELLKKRGISLNVQDNDGRYPRHLYFKKPKAVDLPVETLDDYVGKYYIGDYLMLEIWREGGRLKIMEFGPDEIYPVAKDFFYFRQAPWTLIFSRDEQGKVDHAQLSFIRRSYTIMKKPRGNHAVPKIPQRSEPPQTAAVDFPVLTGPYLGQKPPGMTPEIFAPGIISTEMSEGSSGFLEEGKVFIFQRFIERRCHTYIMKMKDNRWSEPELIPFWEQLVHNGDFVIAPDGTAMYYQVKTHKSGRLDSDIWRVKWMGEKWGPRIPLPAPVNGPYHESFASRAANGNLYFFSRRPGGVGQSDLYMTPPKEDGYGEPVNIIALNTVYHEWDPWIAPDESYLIFCSTRPGGRGGDDLYISFQGGDGQWQPPIHLDDRFNSPHSENRPCVTRDGRYFFFTSSRRGQRDIYWVDSKIVERLMPKDYTK